MTPAQFFLAAAFIFCCISSLFLFLRTALSAEPTDYAEAKGKIIPAVFYSFTGGMSPFRKETANKHWPTYIAGIIFHIGIFLSFGWLVLYIIDISLPAYLTEFSKIFLTISIISGLGILLKRMLLSKMRYFSCPDDYFSNIIVTVFQIFSLTALINPDNIFKIYIAAGIIFIYLPFGKLRHAVFFILTRFHLGKFFGKRGVWPPGRKIS